jgi:hypothetical protein
VVSSIQIMGTKAQKFDTVDQLADALLPLLEASANVHFLLDHNLLNPQRLRELRLVEDRLLEETLKCLGAVTSPGSASFKNQSAAISQSRRTLNAS